MPRASLFVCVYSKQHQFIKSMLFWDDELNLLMFFFALDYGPVESAFNLDVIQINGPYSKSLVKEHISSHIVFSSLVIFIMESVFPSQETYLKLFISNKLLNAFIIEAVKFWQRKERYFVAVVHTFWGQFQMHLN